MKSHLPASKMAPYGLSLRQSKQDGSYSYRYCRVGLLRWQASVPAAGANGDRFGGPEGEPDAADKACPQCNQPALEALELPDGRATYCLHCGYRGLEAVPELAK